ncbi:TPA: methyltransferase domain-containing protein [Campylobacter jejuni]
MLHIFKKLRKRLRGGGIYIDQIDHKINLIQTHLNKIDFEINYIKTLLLNSNEKNLNALFNTIYQTNAWGCGSGPGSNPIVTKEYVDFLHLFFKEKKIQSIVDIGCGDWQFSKNINFDKIQYTGYDVASFVIEKNNANYKKENINFILYDGDFNKVKSADLVICKDVLQHLPNNKILEFLNILPKFKFALIANDIGLKINEDILASRYRPLDLTKSPFNLNAKKVFSIDRMPTAPDIIVILWENPIYKE